MRLFFADLLMMLSVLFGLMGIPWTPYAIWALAIGAGLATAGVALDWRNGPRWVAYLGCLAIGWQVPGLLAAAILLPTAFLLRTRGRSVAAQ
jgi:hypothetical protein